MIMSDKIFYKISRCEIYSDNAHFYKMLRFVWFKTFVFCIDVYPSEMCFSFMIAVNDMSFPVKSFNLLVLK